MSTDVLTARPLIESMPSWFTRIIWETCNRKISDEKFAKIIQPLTPDHCDEYFYDYHHFCNIFVRMFGAPLDLSQVVSRFPFPHLVPSLLQKRTPGSFVYGGYYSFYENMENVRIRMGTILLRMETFRFIKKWIVEWHRGHREGVIIIRNRKDKLPDIRLTIRFHPVVDGYFGAAFSGRFGKDLEDGCFVIHTKREGTSQRVVEIYWGIYRKDRRAGKKALYAYLDDHSTSVEDLTTALAEVQSISKWDMMGHFVSMTQEYLMNYIESTLYNKSFTSMERLRRFTSTDPVKAGYIWSVNFSTEKERFALAGELEIAVRNQKRFIASPTIQDLQFLLQQKVSVLRKHNSTIYDDLPANLWNNIKDAEMRVKRAEAGTPMGCRGVRYYSSEDMEAARYSLKQAWIKADQWVGRSKRQSSRGF